jgi:hypothetical protein
VWGAYRGGEPAVVSLRPARVVTHIAKTHYSAAYVVVLCTRSAVQGPKVKSNDIAHFGGENTDIGVIFQ